MKPGLLIASVCMWGLAQGAPKITIVSSSSTSVSGPAKCQPNQGCPIYRENCPADGDFFKLLAACDPSDNDKDTLSAKDLAKNFFMLDPQDQWWIVYLPKQLGKAQKCIDLFDGDGDGVWDMEEWMQFDKLLQGIIPTILLDQSVRNADICLPTKITADLLVSALGYISPAKAQTCIEEYDQDGDGSLGLEELAVLDAMMVPDNGRAMYMSKDDATTCFPK